MRTRLLSGLIFGAGLLLVTWYGGWPFGLVAVAGTMLALREFYTLARRAGARPLDVGAYGMAALVVGGVGLGWSPALIGAVAAGGACATLAALVPAGGTPRAWRVLADWGGTWAGVAYLVPPAALLVALRASAQGLTWVILVFAVTWSCDSGAYFAGRAFGRSPFFPAISPNKTREGALSGVIVGAFAALPVTLLGHLVMQPVVALVAGATIAAAAEAGDLAESLFKRQVGVKDSGTLIPGHGGLLDRIDSLLFAAVVTFYWHLLVR